MLQHLFETAPDAYGVTLFNQEPRGNYNRLLLSPVLSGDKSYEEIITHDDDWYVANGVNCRFGEAVVKIDRDAKVVHTNKGSAKYDALVIAAGSAPLILPVIGRLLRAGTNCGSCRPELQSLIQTHSRRTDHASAQLQSLNER